MFNQVQPSKWGDDPFWRMISNWVGSTTNQQVEKETKNRCESESNAQGVGKQKEFLLWSGF